MLFAIPELALVGQVMRFEKILAFAIVGIVLNLSGICVAIGEVDRCLPFGLVKMDCSYRSHFFNIVFADSWPGLIALGNLVGVVADTFFSVATCFRLTITLVYSVFLLVRC